MVYLRSLLITVKILINRILSTGFKKTGFNAAALMDQMTGITTITSTARHLWLEAGKRVVFRFLVANVNQMRLSETNNVATTCEEQQMYFNDDLFQMDFLN